MNLRGYDDWKTRSDDPGRVSRRPSGVPYRCLTCDWRGHGGAKAYDHHVENPAHQIIVRDAPQLGPISFGCCHELAQPTAERTAK